MWPKGASQTHAVIVAQMEAHKAQRRAAVGYIPHPEQPLWDAAGIKHLVGATVIDSHTGQRGVIVHAGTIQAYDQPSVD